MAGIQSKTRGSGDPVIRFNPEGMDGLIKKLKALKVSVNPILRQAARKASTPLVKGAKNILPKRGKPVRGWTSKGKKVFSYGRTGMLRKSIDKRVMTSRRTGMVHAIIGPKRKSGSGDKAKTFVSFAFKRYHRPKKSVAAQKNVMVKVKPTAYSHLYELGFTAKLFGSGRTKPVRGRFYLRKTLASNEQNVINITQQVLQQKIDKVMGTGVPERDGG